MLAWKRGNAVLTAGNVKVTMNPRIRLIPVHELPEVNGASVKSPTGYNLELRDVRVTDAGDYACQVGTLEPQEIIHKLEVLVPPKIDFISPGGGRLDVAKGSPIRLECRGSGNPTPKIYWSRKVKFFARVIRFLRPGMIENQQKNLVFASTEQFDAKRRG